MNELNFHHLRYFYLIAREGSVTKAARRLRLSQPTVSAQLRLLEDQLGAALFERGRGGLHLTEVGHRVYAHAEQIFRLGEQVIETVKGRKVSDREHVVLGITGGVARLSVAELSERAYRAETYTLEAREGTLRELISSLQLGDLDAVLSDVSTASIASRGVKEEVLLESSVGIFGIQELKARYGRSFPKGLSGAPFLLPGSRNGVHSPLVQKLSELGLEVEVRGLFDDTGLMKHFAACGRGLIPAPSRLERSLRKLYGLHRLGTLREVRDRVYLVSSEGSRRAERLAPLTAAAKRLSP